MALVILLGVLVLSSFVMKEGFFVDASGTDVSGSIVSLSLRDLISLLGGLGSTTSSSGSTTTTTSKTTDDDKDDSTLDDQFYTDLRGKIIKDVRKTVRQQLQDQAAGSQTVLTDSCIDSVADQQGTDWMRYIPGKNPADYVRKDSIPCYACSLP